MKTARRILRVALAAAIVLAGTGAQAQQPTKIPRIGYLGGATGSGQARIEALRQGLRDLGYVEGKNIVIEWRYAEGKPDRERALAADLVRLKVEVIVTVGSAATRAAKEATTYDSNCDDAGSRSHWKRVRRQSCATRWKHYWVIER